ncbi:MAG TPA: SurA N-terminal domain-containing protein [Candidatus Deferrimicrobiaceae bacterium]|nr:SurA N-terminal domain-containing protein [Candidatus Deferrimicrobiaceae bacterium]
MNRSFVRSVLSLAVVVAAFGVLGCSKPQAKNETVAEVNGGAIQMAELREFLGVRGGLTAVAGVTPEQKKEALDRLIAGRLLAQDARAQGLDNTDEFRNFVKKSEQGALITALFRKEVASKGIVSKDDTQAEANKIKAADNTLSDNNANVRAQRSVSEAKIRKIQQDLIAAANKEFPSEIVQPMVNRIIQGEKVPDDAVLATAAGDNITYGYVRAQLEQSAGGMHGDRDIVRNPVAINRFLTRETTGRSLAAYAKKQGIEGTEWIKISRADIERSILIDLLAAKVLEKEVKATDKEVEAYFQEHPEMFVQHGKKVPFMMIKEQLRGFLQNEKRKSAMNSYIEELKKKAKITVNEKVLGDV